MTALKIDPKDLEWNPARLAAARAKVRPPVIKRAQLPPVPAPQEFMPNVVTFVPPRKARTIYLTPIGPACGPRTLYPHSIGPIPRDILRLSTETLDPVPVRKSPKQILAEVCAKYNVKPHEILSRRRDQAIMIPRHEVFYRLKRETTLSYPQMGRLMGGRDHTTVLHSVRKYEKLLSMGVVEL
jgi:hypothetical protein